MTLSTDAVEDAPGKAATGVAAARAVNIAAVMIKRLMELLIIPATIKTTLDVSRLEGGKR